MGYTGFRYKDIYQVLVDMMCDDNGHMAVSLAQILGYMQISL